MPGKTLPQFEPQLAVPDSGIRNSFKGFTNHYLENFTKTANQNTDTCIWHLSRDLKLQPRHLRNSSFLFINQLQKLRKSRFLSINQSRKFRKSCFLSINQPRQFLKNSFLSILISRKSFAHGKKHTEILSRSTQYSNQFSEIRSRSTPVTELTENGFH